MSTPPALNRKPYEATPYAALRAGDAVETLEPTPAATAGPRVSDDGAADYFMQEAGKLEQLRAALWAAFQAGPAAGIPSTLIDLTIAYTGALRLELNLLGFARPRQHGPSGLRAMPRDKP
jgi:hypothetical protein